MQPIDSRFRQLISNPHFSNPADRASCPDMGLRISCTNATEKGFAIKARRFPAAEQRWDDDKKYFNVAFATDPDKGDFFLGYWLSYIDEHASEDHELARAANENLLYIQAQIIRAARKYYGDSIKKREQEDWSWFFIFLLIAILAILFFSIPAIRNHQLLWSLTCVLVLLVGWAFVSQLSRRVVTKRFSYYWKQNKTARIIDELEELQTPSEPQ